MINFILPLETSNKRQKCVHTRVAEVTFFLGTLLCRGKERTFHMNTGYIGVVSVIRYTGNSFKISISWFSGKVMDVAQKDVTPQEYR